ncbi:bifunctional phosphopantothenoylcysteine decarboxylase/phosphopantothenate--cysteine ligase CoaBC [Halomonas sp. McH1-25]|uniref:bifunctional phosphopantothenoylcysteine decarboxylase/phosphopantothenate--cysteine ligase CoaBC n=1 Tax=unclassified Halomonas TaxID=2609666 RepID=UPI001EF5C5E4|nr:MULTISPECIES: bifunctional phosphopantothenoylcysteine decarboxylase/phosphopantothenate--cysteine ligase CoaBC [unclassified Halomonas]MCG7601674.1 bifunctional phosphopantothenoylcysteine decarboxylase/phosphopantothenate--cysteine ligase CoaBC [Halomonas sp. McH1-25]MCP1342205.1 bifunctional phosphopantothenoylcysteine decarboxylase/phosphopantothenate--cysteine ligase CoaBC [Halomonas sp. FL8]MCP1362810.1 bifunctional phosphopantothenoylcysteine decarboxylase/phosphopantothenate--cysteine
MSHLAGKRILLGISAGIAAYKSAHLARLLKKAGAEVRVVMTEGAQAFITPLTLQALTGEAVRTSLLDPEAEAGMGHIELARWAEVVLIAPATADLMARLAHGHADDLLTTLCLATEADCLMAPAMNQAMWRHPATQDNVTRLAEYGWQLLGPDAGDQACGDIGPGRMLEPEAIVARLTTQPDTLPFDSPLADGPDSATPDDDKTLDALGLTITLTAGPTREPLDPVRYLTNHSSGKMGYALADAAARRGARVRLISGPVNLPTPAGVERIDVESASEMHEAARQSITDSDIFIGCAAVADYRAERFSEHKLKKTPGEETLMLRLVKNPDIVAAVAAAEPRPFVVGFAAETRDVEAYARDKLLRKNLDMIVANDVSQAGLGFGADKNAALLLWRSAASGTGRLELPAQSKATLADTIIAVVVERFHAKQHETLQTPQQDTP